MLTNSHSVTISSQLQSSLSVAMTDLTGKVTFMGGSWEVAKLVYFLNLDTTFHSIHELFFQVARLEMSFPGSVCENLMVFAII